MREFATSLILILYITEATMLSDYQRCSLVATIVNTEHHPFVDITSWCGVPFITLSAINYVSGKRKLVSTTFIFMIINITIPHSCAASSLPLLLLPLLTHPLCLDLLVCSVYFSLSVGVRFGTSGISSSLLSFNPAVLPEGIRRKAPGS